MSRFLDCYQVILLDMGHTFLFDCDRFGPEFDYFATYQSLGGRELGAEQVASAIEALFEAILADQSDPARYNDFRTVDDHLQVCPRTHHLPAPERKLIRQVFAHHEVGTISPRHAGALHALASSHPLGLISNIWSPCDLYEAEFKRAGVFDLFDHRVWSSNHRCIKPSHRIFQLAFDHFGISPGQAVYVGDNPRRDVAPSKELGMGSVWIRNDLRPLAPGDPQPDLIIDHLEELAEAS